jgi:hypothetical protein
MIAYLLHKLPDSEREAFEDRWMEDSDLYDRLQDVEAELLDDYVSGALPPEDRDLVARHLLGGPVQDQKLLFARTLRTAFPAPARTRVSWRGYLAAAAVVILAAGVALLGWRNLVMRSEIPARSNPPAPAQPGATASAPNASPDSVYVAEIPSGATRRSATGSLTEFRLPASAQMLRIDLQLDPGDESQVFSAAVSQDTRSVWKEEPIRAERRPFGFVVSVWIPSSALGPGEYQVKLSAGGTAVDYYRFRVQRAP